MTSSLIKAHLYTSNTYLSDSISWWGMAGEYIRILDRVLVYGYSDVPYNSSIILNITNITQTGDGPATMTITTSTNHGFVVNQYIYLNFYSRGYASAFYANHYYRVLTTPSSTTFTVSSLILSYQFAFTLADNNTVSPAYMFNIANITYSSGVATVTTSVNHNFLRYEYIFISGVTNDVLLNGEFRVESTNGSNQFTFNVTTVSSTFSGIEPNVCLNRIDVTSISVNSSVATVTVNRLHYYNINDVIVIDGAADSVFNNEFRITNVLGLTFSFSISTVLTTTTTSTLITVKNASLGWSKPFAGTNLAVYRSTDPTSSQHYLRVDDSVAQFCYVWMCERMSNINDIPYTSTKLTLTRSDRQYTANYSLSISSRKIWYIIGNTKSFYFLTSYYASGYINLFGYPWIYFFGDFNSVKPSDVYDCMIITDTNFSTIDGTTTPLNLISRSYTGVPGQIQLKKSAPGFNTYMSYNSTATNSAAPDPANLSYNLSSVFIYENNYNIYRGTLPGFYFPLEQVNNFSVGQTFPVNNKVLISFQHLVYNNTIRNCFFDLTGPW